MCAGIKHNYVLVAQWRRLDVKAASCHFQVTEVVRLQVVMVQTPAQ